MDVESNEFQLFSKYLEKDFARKLPEKKINPEHCLFEQLHSTSSWRDNESKPLMKTSFLLKSIIFFFEEVAYPDSKIEIKNLYEHFNINFP